MSSTHFALYYHLVFGTKHQEPTIHPQWRSRLHAYLGGCTTGVDGVPVIIGGVIDHVHLLVSLKPTHQISEVLRDIKRKSSEWVHKEIGDRGFVWQDGYGVFSVSLSQIPTVRRYIENQEDHHRTRTFREEYVEFDERYLW